MKDIGVARSDSEQVLPGDQEARDGISPGLLLGGDQARRVNFVTVVSVTYELHCVVVVVVVVVVIHIAGGRHTVMFREQIKCE